MSGKDAFEERLKRLRPSEAPSNTGATDTTLPDQLGRMRASTGGGATLFAMLAFIMLAVGGGAFATMMFVPEIIFAGIE